MLKIATILGSVLFYVKGSFVLESIFYLSFATLGFSAFSSDKVRAKMGRQIDSQVQKCRLDIRLFAHVCITDGLLCPSRGLG